MHITYHGLSCFKLIAKTSGRGSDDVTVVLGPFDKSTGMRPLQSKADVAIVPHASREFSGEDSLRGEQIVLDLPGEYAVAGVNVVSLAAPADIYGGKERGMATVSILDIEGMKVVYLGALGGELTPDQIDAASGADILFLPIGDEKGLDGKGAEILARKIEPKIIIPMHYFVSTSKKLSTLKVQNVRDESDFCSNIGNCPVPKDFLDKYTVKPVDIEGKTMEVVMLNVV